MNTINQPVAQLKAETAAEAWTTLETHRRVPLDRAIRCARYTLPGLIMDDGENTDTHESGRIWQSVGAQLVNNLTTRLMLALFAPSRPFVRLDPEDDFAAAAEASGVSEEVLRQGLGMAERKIVKSLDKMSLRPKLFLTLKHLLVGGNVLMVLDEKGKMMRVMGIRHFVVKRDVAGRVQDAIIKERVLTDELPKLLREACAEKETDYYVWIRRDPETMRYTVSHWVGGQHVAALDKTYTEEKLPYRVLTWDLSDDANYGTSLVSDNEGDFASLEDASRAQIAAAVLASEFRWLINPSTGMTPRDFEKVANGGYIPGVKDGVSLVNAAGEVAQAMAAQQNVLTNIINRLGRTFILSSAVVRDAERVTTEEIRLLANELENGLGGGYSRLAVDMQLPLARFLMAISSLSLKDYGAEDDISLTVVTGLDALSRSGDLEQLKAWLQDIMSLSAAGPEVTAPLKLDEIYRALATPRGIDVTKYLKTPQQMEADRTAETERQIAIRQSTQGETQQ